MKKVILVELALVLLLAGLMTVLLYEKDIRYDVSEKEIENCISDFVAKTSVEKAQDLRIRRNLNLEKDDFDLVLYYMPKETMDADEFFMVRGSADAIKQAKAMVEERIKSQLTAFSGYGEHQTENLKNAKVEEVGNYLIYIVSDDSDGLLTKIRSLLEVSR